MHKLFILGNVILIAMVAYLVFGPQNTITAFAVLEDGPNHVILGGVLYFNMTDMDTGKVKEKQYLTDKNIYLVRMEDDIEDFSKIRQLEEWELTGDADGEEKHCNDEKYPNQKYFYDDNENKVKDENEFEFFGTYVDTRGCFKVKLPDSKFIVVISK